MSKKYWLEIYGCQMNFAEGYALENSLKQQGWEQADSPEEADAAILHTCSVRQTAENRIWGRIGFFKHLKQNHPAKLVVMGCMAERLKVELRKKEPAIDLVVGNFEKEQLPDLIENLDRNNSYTAHTAPGPVKEEYDFQDSHQREKDFHAFVPIMHGCNNFCTYCIVPHVRGREVSRSPQEIRRELQGLEAKGVKEITLLGQNVNSYSYGGSATEAAIRPYKFPDILKEILDELDKIEWVRFLTSHPKDVPQQLIEMIASEPRLCKHIHLPVQHGSSSVLKRMNRKYTREDYLQLVTQIRSTIDEPALTTDIMIGFPGETEADFQATLDLMREVEFDDAFMYYFNPRTGTPAAEFEDQIDHQTKLDRLSEIIALQKEISRKRRARRVGKEERVLVESPSKKNPRELLARTERDHRVVFPGDATLIGTFVNVRIDSMVGNTLKGVYTG
ncbi:MAG: tRNA (N6-isopentenyl adenosine(37)-C2)-methylthiotransferase MiaB [Spirochaetaceae bacterium]|nr:tRNA (N6-isopentenyl adenosine(37)-C2)-methylthiotransferase MiaB [Spirochaetaceae bacterium]MCF7948183.1 tRNA (N6-isopentenyl adenosine(37)-C2)-methylthiotransferase MiaB [Spirochaetia bacterium]MCF7950799.1 tRNA (N6-isopentenyl adenosine(37)-C2)-methylthiotransferase MiaB [Spirochaetaceae bacterium]